eukprot:scaffold47_cov258-Pinguiococcus_pyrenoidosus.AAC.44
MAEPYRPLTDPTLGAPLLDTVTSAYFRFCRDTALQNRAARFVAESLSEKAVARRLHSRQREGFAFATAPSSSTKGLLKTPRDH